ncbi:MAG: cupin domain-containing protein [Alphaproteobacteria bacterium]|nr:cupin domain-containing protein [Rhizobiaceae bacterium]MBU3961577.1 cupin domain-containing protein [Alphaproteobacteria bacterium]MBU4050259.1 cupin domain-containing protein [Alphaproteobacteria bacterium]MBU4088304.1 cupin domain-containing protein [Alphaproteobacteria bacterium]MBU4158191.1 cupin domain-containing protein [Alphaproteobacteria bacterium]
MSHYLNFDPSTVEPEEGAPAADRLLSGNPRFTTWNLEEAPGGVNAGIWQSTPGKWRISYEEWEYFHVLEGHSVVTEDGGKPVHLKPGDRMILRPGFNGTWEVVETTRKDYVIRI